MAANAARAAARAKQGRPRPHEIDWHVAARIRERRIMLGLTQIEMAELIGVAYQQAHKYETGVNRISAGRLYQIAQALDVGVDYFFEGLEQPLPAPTPQQRQTLELARNFASLSRRHQEALCALARVLAGTAEDGGPET